MRKVLFTILFSFLIVNFSQADFKYIKKKAKVTKPEMIFPIQNEKENCIRDLYINPDSHLVRPVLKVKAPSGYGLDDRFDHALGKFEDFSFPCSGGNIEACKNVIKVLLEWAKSNAAQRTGPSDGEGRHWNDTLTVNLYIASPMMAAYSFAKQILYIPEAEDAIIKNWFKKIVKRNKHLMYKYSNYKSGSGASGVPKRAHNHALSSAMSHMQLGILISDDNLFRTAFRNYEAAIKYQRKDGSMPIETRRGGRAMFYQGRAMNALSVIAIIAENQGYNIWDYEYKGKNFHNIVKFFIDFTENNEIVFKYAKSMKHPGPAKNYKKQDLNSRSSSNWGWLYAYATRFPDHDNIKRIRKWSLNKSSLNSYQWDIVHHYLNIKKKPFSSASWTVVEPNCHFTK
ncbi:alginate lyase family protein [Candidatus Pelagibacter sp.]|nr:alginate lyase family protein [Candidatus Pelagibacter sp.]